MALPRTNSKRTATPAHQKFSCLRHKIAILVPATDGMRSRNVFLTLAVLIGVFLFAIFRKWQEPPVREAFDRTPQRLYYYAFALCRMQCLHISKGDINTVMQKGVVHMNKSNRNRQPCATFAVQGRTGSHYIRAVFEQCRNGTYVVNCYNLENSTPCDCATDYTPKTQ
jgi:hypothetical protein